MLAIRYTRKQTEDGEELYIGTTLVLVAEIIKFIFCLGLLLIQKSGSLKQTYKVLTNEVFLKPNETFKLAIPSSLYLLQNNLVLLALSWLDAATFQVQHLSVNIQLNRWALSNQFNFTGHLPIEDFDNSFLFSAAAEKRNQTSSVAGFTYFDERCCFSSGRKNWSYPCKLKTNGFFVFL